MAWRLQRFHALYITILFIAGLAFGLQAQELQVSVQLGSQQPVVVLDPIRDLQGLSFDEILKKIEEMGIRVVQLSRDPQSDTEIEAQYRERDRSRENASKKPGQVAIKVEATYFSPSVRDHPFEGSPVIVFNNSESTVVVKHELVHHLIRLGHAEGKSDLNLLAEEYQKIDEEAEKLLESERALRRSGDLLARAYVSSRLEEISIRKNVLLVRATALGYEEEFLVNNLLLSHRHELGLTEQEQASLLLSNATYLDIAKKDIEHLRIQFREMRSHSSMTEQEKQALANRIEELTQIEERLDRMANDMRKTYPELDILAHEILSEAEPDFKVSDYRTRLGLADKDLTEEEIKRAYRKLALKYHPDKGSLDPQRAEKYQAYTEAFQALMREVNGEIDREWLDDIRERARRYAEARENYVSTYHHYRQGSLTNWVSTVGAGAASSIVVGTGIHCMQFGFEQLSNTPFFLLATLGAIPACFHNPSQGQTDRSPIEKPIQSGVRSGLIRGTVAAGCLGAFLALIKLIQ